jgi:hypothetical protein
LQPEPPIEQITPKINTETILPQPPVNQFIVEKISGLLFTPDIVRIDNTVVSGWNELYDNRKITEVHIQTLKGKAVKCRFKPIKDQKIDGKGIIQIPERILLALETAKGELVMVKPFIEE